MQNEVIKAQEVVRIVSEAGLGRGTRVILPDGTEIPNVLKIEIDPIEPDSLLTAKITVRAALEIVAVAEITEAARQAQ